MSARPPITFLDRLSDVDISAPSNGQALIFNSGLVKWQNLAVPGGELATLSDVLIGTPSDGDILMFSGGSWINYGPLSFADLAGNIAIAQMAGGAGADASHYWRGDNSWAAPPVGTIPVTANLLVGDNSGNAIPADQSVSGGLIYGAGNSQLALAVDGNFDTNVFVRNLLGGATGACSFAAGNDGAKTLKLQLLSTANAGGGGVRTAGDGILALDGGNIDIILASGFTLKLSNNGGTSERMRFGSGIMAGTTVDKGQGTINAAGGYYMNGNKVGGVATITATVDQTATAETAHATFTVPANSAVIGTVYHIHASGNVDNGTTGITYTPRIRWGGTGGTDMVGLNVAAFFSTTTARTNQVYVFDARVTIRTIGATGTAVTEYNYIERTTSATGVETSHCTNSGATATTIDTTANKDLVLTWVLSLTTGTPHIRTISGYVEVIQP